MLRVIVITCCIRFQSALFCYQVDASADVSTNDTVLSQHNNSTINRYMIHQLVVIHTQQLVSGSCLVVYKPLCSDLEKPTCPLGFSAYPDVHLPSLPLYKGLTSVVPAIIVCKLACDLSPCQVGNNLSQFIHSFSLPGLARQSSATVMLRGESLCGKSLPPAGTGAWPARSLGSSRPVLLWHSRLHANYGHNQ